VDQKFPAWPGNLPQEVETKGQYYVKMTQEREMVRKIREEQEQRIRVDQICLKGKEDDLARRRKQLIIVKQPSSVRSKSSKSGRQLSRTRRMQWNHLQGVTEKGNNHTAPSRTM